MISLAEIRNQIERRKGQRDLIVKALEVSEANFSELEIQVKYAEEAQRIAQVVAQQTQQELEYHISRLVSLALAAVFPDPYEFGVDFVVRRSQTEADFWFNRNGEKISPMSAAGGGAVDVASFALRPAMWSLQPTKSNAVLVLDEPFRFLSKGFQWKAAEMLKSISKDLGLQIIMVSHNEELIDAADRAFNTTIRGGKSYVREVRKDNRGDHGNQGEEQSSLDGNTKAGVQESPKRSRRLYEQHHPKRRQDQRPVKRIGQGRKAKE